MKYVRIVPFVFAVVPMAMAQETGRTTIQTTKTVVPGEANLLSELWKFDDATTLAPGQVDLRFTGNWITSNAPANNGNSDDDFIFTPSLWFGVAEGLEVFIDVPIWLGDGGDAGAFDDGNADTNVGFTWRFLEQGGGLPAMALKGTVRAPTGDNSQGVDGEARLVLTNEYDNGIRSHFNAFAKTVNSDNWKSATSARAPRRAVALFGGPDVTPFRHFQWGAAVGFDGPLCADGAVRWVLDYLHRSSIHQGRPNMNILEAGWEWAMSEAQKLGFSLQVGLDGGGDTPNLGAGIAYAHSLTY